MVAIARRRWLRLTGGRRYETAFGPIPARRENPDFWQLLGWKLAARAGEDPVARAENIRAGRLEFIGIAHDWGNTGESGCGGVLDHGGESNHFDREVGGAGYSLDWHMQTWPEAPRLWCFHLHYHEFLLDLAAAEQSASRGFVDHAWRTVADWIERNRLSDPRSIRDAWHPYCISRRLPVWLSLWEAAEPPEAMRETVLRSIVTQARFLERHLERDVGGNHLLENLRALALVDAWFSGTESDGRLERVERLLDHEVNSQILPHGEHFERSPMYHCIMLEAVLDVRDVCRRIRPSLAEKCDAVARRMADFLVTILHPDGEIPLLSDTCFGEVAPARQLLTRASDAEAVAASWKADWLSPTNETGDLSLAVRTTGSYWTVRENHDVLLFDAGRVGPDHLPAHAHADLLNFEVSVAGRRWIVDGGVFNYQDDEMRRYCRGSAAHNVLTIDDADQCDVYSRFRMGYRGWPSELVSGETDGVHWVWATHNAYRRLGVPRVGRWIGCRSGGSWLVVDWAEGQGTHRLTNRLHFHPEVVVEPNGDDRWRLRLGDETRYLWPLAKGEVTLQSGWYCPRLGCRLACSVLLWTAREPLPMSCGWQFDQSADSRTTEFEWNAEGQLSVRPFGQPAEISLLERHRG